MDFRLSFKNKLDSHHSWPCEYLFKFVVPAGKTTDLLALFPDESFQSKQSKAGNYTSFTLRKVMESSDEVIAIYETAGKVEGLIAL